MFYTNTTPEPEAGYPPTLAHGAGHSMQPQPQQPFFLTGQSCDISSDFLRQPTVQNRLVSLQDQDMHHMPGMEGNLIFRTWFLQYISDCHK